MILHSKQQSAQYPLLNRCTTASRN